ncbi:MAG: transporter permease [Enterovirga sp.]|nr:transporter permease [Enterovirga sp.]
MKRSKRPALSAAVMTCLLSSAAVAQDPKISNGTVKIGVLADMSGVFSDLSGPGSVIAAQMAIDDFVAGSKPPFKVELVSADHQNKSDIAANIARQWFDTAGVDMITDVINSGVALAVSQVTESKNKVLMVTGAGSTRLTNEQCSPNTISYTWDTYAYSNAHARIVKSLGLETWYFLAVDYVLGKSLVEGTSEALARSGGKVVGVVNHPISATDFSSFVLQAQGSGAKVIGLANAGTDLHNAIKAANDFGLTKKQTLVPLVGTITDVHALGPETTQGMVMVEPFYWNLNDKTRVWSRKFMAKHGKMPNFIHAGTYSAVSTYLKAVLTAQTDAPGEVMDRMKAGTVSDIYTESGKIRQDGRMVYDIYLVQVKAPKDVKELWDYFEVKEKIPGDEAFQPLSASKCRLVSK